MSRSKEPTRAQLSSRLAYNAQVPAFLQRMQAKVAGGRPLDDDDDDEYGNDDGEVDEFGRERVRAKPPVPERPESDAGSADEDDEDERPQVVVLREGKHLSEREAENERRKAKGLSPLPEAATAPVPENGKTSSREQPASKKTQSQSLAFSSGSSGPKRGSAKRKAVGDADDETAGEAKPAASTKKKPKKAQKKLLSFGDDA
ncbi:hypothetical protein CERSUDRAFT_89133 [Gelatoporia subvermispora B]|uniref:DUF4604 domain-containing protein n=1 Tax=Ceriporiopsis subvermispora (strain B) TaxID=914234 RepID=M2QZA7_CERS8|nr:hypothetical protein CERSUDRAFT_89133 [Gelatoporia subvermispora B]